MTRRPVVAVFTHSATLGGAELGLLRYLSAQTDFDARVLLLEEGPLADSLRGAGIPVAVARQSPFGVLAALLALRRGAASGRYDLVLTNSMRAATLYSAVLPPRRSHLYYLQDIIDGGYFSRLKRAILRVVTLPRVGGFLVNSAATLASVPARFRRRPAELVYTVSGTTGISARAADEHEQPRVLSLSRIARWKGIHVLVAAVRGSSVALPVTLAGGAFFGEDDYEAEVKALAADDPRLRFVGHVDDVPALLARHDVLVHCSLTPEPFGQVIVQGMTAGLVVVATRGGGPSEIIEDGVSGILVPAGDESALRLALERVVSERGLRDALSAAAALRAARFSDERIVRTTSEAIGRFVSLALSQRRSAFARSSVTSP